ncbi:hypothetical protein [Corynebacterium mayonis]
MKGIELGEAQIDQIREQRGPFHAVKAPRENHPGLGLVEAKGVVDKR